MQKERQDETQFTTQKINKIGGKTSLGPSFFVWLKTSSYFLANFWTGFVSVFLPI
jgi:hypothetical protein